MNRDLRALQLIASLPFDNVKNSSLNTQTLRPSQLIFYSECRDRQQSSPGHVFARQIYDQRIEGTWISRFAIFRYHVENFVDFIFTSFRLLIKVLARAGKRRKNWNLISFCGISSKFSANNLKPYEGVRFLLLFRLLLLWEVFAEVSFVTTHRRSGLFNGIHAIRAVYRVQLGQWPSENSFGDIKLHIHFWRTRTLALGSGEGGSDGLRLIR